MAGQTAIVWFLQDLRLTDNPALVDALDRFDRVVPVYLWTPAEHGGWAPGGAARWWLHHSLESLDGDLRDKGSRLVLRQGEAALPLLRALIAGTGAEAVIWNARYEPALRERDRALAAALREDGIEVRAHPSRILHDPRRLRTKQDDPYQVFTPFWKRFQEQVDVGPGLEKPAMGRTRAPATWPDAEDLASLDLYPRPDWAGGIAATWTPGERGAQQRLTHFVENLLLDYSDGRDRPGRDGTSRMSPHLAHGELSPRQIWNAAAGWVRNHAMKNAADAYLREIAWREFAYHLLFHFPHTTTEPLREKFRDFPWRTSKGRFDAWTKGRTGYPMVDAGMRELWRIGWMHNRVRMITASFLTKDLLIPWQDGARWFWDTLVDADLASNTLGWQWTAGCGADAQPFFRIFNPVSQGSKWDPDGTYVRTYVPELAGLPSEFIHRPWQLGEPPQDYPHRLVDHSQARDEALEAYGKVR